MRHEELGAQFTRAANARWGSADRELNLATYAFYIHRGRHDNLLAGFPSPALCARLPVSGTDLAVGLVCPPETALAVGAFAGVPGVETAEDAESWLRSGQWESLGELFDLWGRSLMAAWPKGHALVLEKGTLLLAPPDLALAPGNETVVSVEHACNTLSASGNVVTVFPMKLLAGAVP